MSSFCARAGIVQQIAAIDRDLRRLVRSDPTIKRLTTVPGVGPVTAVAFACAIDYPNRFKHARDAGPYLGLSRPSFAWLVPFWSARYMTLETIAPISDDLVVGLPAVAA